MKGLSKRSPCLLLVGLRPEEREQRIAPVEPRRICQRQVGQERQALGLHNHRAQLLTRAAPQIDRAKSAESHYGRGHRSLGVAVIWQITIALRGDSG